MWYTSGQDGDVGRHTVPPCTTKRRTTTNLKTKNKHLPENQTVWKSDNQGVKEEAFIQTARRGRDRQPGWRGRAAWCRLAGQRGKCGSWWIRWTHICVWINWEEQLGSKRDHTTQGSSAGKESLKTSDCKNLWGLRWWEKLLASQQSSLETPTGY